MKTERVTFLASPDFKTFLAKEAERTGVSVAELIRQRCEGGLTEDEQTLSQLSAQLRASVKDAQASLRDGLAAADSALAELKRAAGLRKKMKAAA